LVGVLREGLVLVFGFISYCEQCTEFARLTQLRTVFVILAKLKDGDMKRFTTGSVISRDGIVIGYRQIGQGPALLLLHGGLNAGQHLMPLAEELSDAFTVYVPDRRGRGLSPYSGENTLAKERDDIEALVAHTGGERIFGHSVGGIVTLFVAHACKSIRKVAVYDPPFSTNGSVPVQWFPRCLHEIQKGKTADALVTALKGMKVAPPLFRWLPRFGLIPLMKWMSAADSKNVKDGFMSTTDIIPTLKMDIPLILEAENTLSSLARLDTDTLLLCGSKTPGYLKLALGALERTLPHARTMQLRGLDHVGPSSEGDPKRVAVELRRFFMEQPSSARVERAVKN
jgi:pimeloyl-ACP methyl ester carboxylesterase